MNLYEPIFYATHIDLCTIFQCKIYISCIKFCENKLVKPGNLLTWSIILKSADQVDVFDRAIGKVIGRLVPTTVLCSKSGDKQWFDASCQRAYDAKQTVYCAWCRACRADHWCRFVFARTVAQRVYGAVLVLQGSHIMKAPGILGSTPPVHIRGGRHL